MAAVRVFVLVSLLCLSIAVESESRILHGEQSLTEILDYDSQDTGIDPFQATKKDNTKNTLSVVEKKHSVPDLSKREQFAVELVDESTPNSKATREFSSGNAVKQKAIEGQALGILSKEEASLVDDDVNTVLNYYGYQENNGPKKENPKGLRIQEPMSKMKERPVGKNIGLDAVRNSNLDKTLKMKALKQQTINSAKQVQHSVNLDVTKQRLRYHQNKKQEVAFTAKKPRIFNLQNKKIRLDPKLAKTVNKKVSQTAKTSSKDGYVLQVQKNKLDLSQQKNVINYNPLQNNNGKLLSLKNNFVKDIPVKNEKQASWLPMKDYFKFFQDDNFQFPHQNQHPNAAKAAQEYMNMPNTDILKLVQNDAALVQKENASSGTQGRNSSKALRGGVDIASPDWLPVKEHIHGIQFDVIQDDKNKMTPHVVKGIQNDMTGSQNNYLPNQVNVSQNFIAQTRKNRTKIQNDLRPKQSNDWLPINDNGLAPDMSQNEGLNKTANSSNKMKMEMKSKSSLAADSLVADGLNATAVRKFENNARYGNDSSDKHGTLSNDTGVENIHPQAKLNFTSLKKENSTSNFKQIKNEKDVTKPIWSAGKVIHSPGQETLQMNSWGPWSTCSDSCGKNGLQIRTRKCAHAQNDHPDCKGSSINWKWCATVDVCPDAGLHIVSHNNNATYADVIIEGNTLPSQWGSWSTCSKRCGTQSLRIRTRNCPGQRSKETGVCVEPTMQWTWCKQVPCKVPQYATMKFGYKNQTDPSALSTNIAHKVDKSSSPVIHTDNGIVFHDNCVVSPWSKWSKCSKSCGENSFKFRTRSCDCDYKQLCKSSTLQREHCMLRKCEGEENYGPWSAFSTCTKPCGGGWKKRTRRCKHTKGRRHLCDQDLLIGVKICNTHKCSKTSKHDAMIANVDPSSMCGFNPCAEFGCMDNRDSKCLADTSCDPVFFNLFGQIDDRCRGWQRYEVKNPTLFCGYDPCLGSNCQRAFGRCSVDLNCKSFVLGADGTAIDCNTIQYPF